MRPPAFWIADAQSSLPQAVIFARSRGEAASLVPLLRGETRAPHEFLFWEHEGHRAVRTGDWKLVARHKQPWALYNLAEDRTELKDVATEHPERVNDLKAAYQEWAKRCQVIPWDQAPKKKW